MRPGQNRRMRGRSRTHKSPNLLTKSFESNGPDVKIRGTAQHIAEKYTQLARDANAAGDPVAAENYYQHAEHYSRIIASAQEHTRAMMASYTRNEDDGDEELEENASNSDHLDDSSENYTDEFEVSSHSQTVDSRNNDSNYGAREPRYGRQNRDDRSSDRTQRPERRDRVERTDRYERNDRHERVDHNERNDRNERSERSEYQDRSERRDRPERADRSARPERQERPERVEQQDSPERTERQDRPERVDRRPRFLRRERSPMTGEDRRPVRNRETPSEQHDDVADGAMLPAFLTAPIRTTALTETKEVAPVVEVVSPVIVPPVVAEEAPAPKPRRRRVTKVTAAEVPEVVEKAVGE